MRLLRGWRGIAIGCNGWIGARVTVLKGVRIGDGAVIGAGSVVTRDIASQAVVAGSPARMLRWRFGEADREQHTAAMAGMWGRVHVDVPDS